MIVIGGCDVLISQGTDVIPNKPVPSWSSTAENGAVLLENPPKTVKKGEKCPGVSHPLLARAFHWLNPTGS